MRENTNPKNNIRTTTKRKYRKHRQKKTETETDEGTERDTQTVATQSIRQGTQPDIPKDEGVKLPFRGMRSARRSARQPCK